MRINDGDVFSSSVKGNVRKQNEDSCGVFEVPNGKLYIVCDGMGGHAGGATASKIGVDSIANYFQQAKYPDVKLALADALEYANLQIIDAANEMPSLKGMGTTACVLLIQGEEAWIAHCGDSRIYLYCAEQQWLHRITKDHSYVQGLVDQGIITDAEAESHPNKNRILKALGIKPDCKPTICGQPILPANGDTFLICSDGLSGMVNDEQLQYVLQQEGTILNKGQMMIQLALQAGGVDNITTQLIKISDSPHAHSVFVSQNPKERMTVVPPIQTSKPSGCKKPTSKGLPKIFYGTTAVVVILIVCGVIWTTLPKFSNKPSVQEESSNSSVNINTNYNSIENEETPTVSDNVLSQAEDNYVIEYWEVYPANGKHFIKSGKYEEDIKVDKFCTDKNKNYRYKQRKGEREINAGVKQNVNFLYIKTVDGKEQPPTINKPEKTKTPSEKCVKVEKFKCDEEGKLEHKLEVIEDVQWRYLYSENGINKELSGYYETEQIVKENAQNKLVQVPDSILCRVEWYNYTKDVQKSLDNKSKYDSYLKQLLESKNKKTETFQTEENLVSGAKDDKSGTQNNENNKVK